MAKNGSEHAFSPGDYIQVGDRHGRVLRGLPLESTSNGIAVVFANRQKSKVNLGRCERGSKTKFMRQKAQHEFAVGDLVVWPEGDTGAVEVTRTTDKTVVGESKWQRCRLGGDRSARNASRWVPSSQLRPATAEEKATVKRVTDQLAALVESLSPKVVVEVGGKRYLLTFDGSQSWNEVTLTAKQEYGLDGAYTGRLIGAAEPDGQLTTTLRTRGGCLWRGVTWTVASDQTFESLLDEQARDFQKDDVLIGVPDDHSDYSIVGEYRVIEPVNLSGCIQYRAEDVTLECKPGCTKYFVVAVALNDTKQRPVALPLGPWLARTTSTLITGKAAD